MWPPLRPWRQTDRREYHQQAMQCELWVAISIVICDQVDVPCFESNITTVASLGCEQKIIGQVTWCTAVVGLLYYSDRLFMPCYALHILFI